MRHLIWQPVRAARLEDLDPLTADRIAENILMNYTSWKSERRGYEDVWREIDRHVNQFDPNHTPFEWADRTGHQLMIPHGFGSKLKMTNVYAHREGLVAAVMKYLMENDYDFFDIVTMDHLDEEPAIAVKHYLLWLFDVMDFEASFTPFVRDVVQYGTAIASYEWHRELVPRWRREELIDPVSGQRLVVDYEARETVYDAPKFTPLNLYFTVLDPSADNIKTATLIFKKPESPFAIMANQAYRNINWDFVNKAPDFGAGPDITLQTDREQTRRNYAYDPQVVFRGKKEVFEAWGDFTDGVTLYRNYVAEILEGRLIRFEPNPYLLPHKPFVVARYTTETNRIYGHSPLASITGIQAGFDTISNQYIDYWNMEINRPLLVQANTIVRSQKENRTKLPPVSKDAVWTVRSTDGVKRLDWGSRSANMDPTPMLHMLDQQMQRATGDNELISGGKTPDKYLRTGVAMTAADAGSGRLNLYAKGIEKEAILTVLEMTVDFLRQMNVPERTFKRKDVPNQTVQFNPVFLMNSIKFTMRGASYNMTKQVQTTNFIQFLMQLFSNPMTAMALNPIKAIILAGEALGIRNVRELISPQAHQMLEMTPPNQLPFMQRVMRFLGGGGGTPKPMEDTQLGELPERITADFAPAFGGVNAASEQPAAFDFVSQ